MGPGLFGREQELAWLAGQLRAGTGAAGGRVVLISGEAGVGKTSLVAEAIPDDAVRFWISYPSARFAAASFGLRRLAEIAGPAAGELRAQLVESDAIPGGWKLLSICQATDEVLRSYVPCVLVLDDLQWADELTLAWLSQIGDLLETASVAVVTVARGVERVPQRVSDALVPLRRRHRLESLELGPLSLNEVAGMVEGAGHNRVMRIARELYERTDGLPFAVEELLRELERRGKTPVPSKDAGVIQKMSIPSLVTAVVREQMRELEEDGQELVAISALAPQPVTEKTLRLLTYSDADRFDAALEDVIESGLLTRRGPQDLRFRHELQREAIRELLSVAEKRSRHRALADVLSRDPGTPPGQVAEQLFEAGEVEEAVQWFERAAQAAARAHDHGNALTYLEAALELCPQADDETKTRLAERATVSARSVNQPAVGLRLIDDALQQVTEPRYRGQLFIRKGRLCLVLADWERRAGAFEAALDAFVQAGDRVGQAIALGELALPVGRILSLDRYVSLGRRGLRIAETMGDPYAIALCAGNLAAAELFTGDPGAFALWSRAAEAIEPSVDPASADLAVRNRGNSAICALGYGAYAEADKAISEGIGLSTDPFWQRWFFALDAVRLWRIGRWDEASDRATRARNGLPLPHVAFATAIDAAIAFERARKPDIASLVGVTEFLISRSTDEWWPLTYSILMRIRAARREPSPERGLIDLIERIVSSGLKLGWEDLLPTTAEINPALYRRVITLLGDLRPVGRRADVSMLFADGLSCAHDGEERAEGLLLEAAEGYEAVGEPYSVARALEAVARVQVRRGKRAGDARVRAAEIYQSLGADRSLATLLRRSGGTRALDRFRVPASQAGSTSPGLTPREREVAELARLGYTARAIAETLGVSIGTAQNHLEHVKSKLGVERKSDVVRFFSPDINGSVRE